MRLEAMRELGPEMSSQVVIRLQKIGKALAKGSRRLLPVAGNVEASGIATPLADLRSDTLIGSLNTIAEQWFQSS